MHIALAVVLQRIDARHIAREPVQLNAPLVLLMDVRCRMSCQHALWLVANTGVVHRVVEGVADKPERQLLSRLRHDPAYIADKRYELLVPPTPPPFRLVPGKAVEHEVRRTSLGVVEEAG